MTNNLNVWLNDGECEVSLVLAVYLYLVVLSRPGTMRLSSTWGLRTCTSVIEKERSEGEEWGERRERNEKEEGREREKGSGYIIVVINSVTMES